MLFTRIISDLSDCSRWNLSYGITITVKQFNDHLQVKTITRGLPWWHSGWESTCQCRGHGLEPWSGKIQHVAEQLSPCATTTEPVHHNYWSPCSTREAATMRSLHKATKSSPLSPQLETNRHAATKTQRSQK